jgi:hypothetical protein
MAQTRKKRRTKHRGNAAGMVEARGRTGRKPAGAEARPADRKADARQRRLDRLDQPPTWRGAVNRAAIAALFLFGLSILLLGQTVAQAAVLVPFLFALYVPLGYYTDRFIYNRRQRSKARAKAG